MDTAPLPDLEQLDFRALKALIVALHEQVFSHRKQLASRDAEIEHLKLLIAKLRRMKFGRSSEKWDRQIEQMELRLGELEASRSKEAAAAKEPAPTDISGSRSVRRPLPDHLPREVRKYLPKENVNTAW